MKFPRYVYVITHVVTGKKYVGSTRNVKSRFADHLNLLKSGRHTVELFQSDCDTFGVNLTCETIDTISDYSEKEKEHEWQKKLGTLNPSTGYNYKDQKWNNHKDWALSHGKSAERREKWKEILENSSEPCVLISACITNSWLGRNGFAKELGISIKELKEIESYKKEPTINQLRKMSELSGIPMDFIFVPNNFN